MLLGALDTTQAKGKASTFWRTPKKNDLRPETESDIEAHYRYAYAYANSDNHLGMKFNRIIIRLEISHQAS